MSATSKRERLVRAASTLVHRQGYHRTTLAEVAAEAGVPLGNVYYYFRTKDDLLRAVVDAHAEQLRAQLAGFEADPDPRGRLRALVASAADLCDLTARYGCPYGSLCQELGKQDQEQPSPAARLLGLYVDWAERQFRLLGAGEQAPGLAVDLIASLQGTSLLASAFQSPRLLLDGTRRLGDRVGAAASLGTSDAP